MPLLSLKNVSKAYGDKRLLDGVSLTVKRGARIGLIGSNGEGKSTLLKIMAGRIEPDDGEVTYRTGAKVAYLEQTPHFAPGLSVFHIVAEGLGEAAAVLERYHATVSTGADLALVARLQEQLEAMGAWQWHARVQKAISRFGLDADAEVARLSGGWQRRVALARAVVAEPDLLLLDEPTNHLDIETIEWLEDFVAASPAAVVFVTHDRYFLDAAAEQIIELDRGTIHYFPCSYAEYLDKKAEMLAVEARQLRRFDKLLAAEERWIRQGIPARRRRNEGRVRALEELRRQRAARRLKGGDINLRVACGIKSGKLLIEAADVDFSYGDTPIVQGFSQRILSGERIGIIGSNGCGKTTLLKLLLGEIKPDCGRIRHGVRLVPAFLTQQRRLDAGKTIRDVLLPTGGNYVHIAGHKPRHIASYLQDFLFDKAQLRAPVASLSGGERARLLLAKLLLSPANLLVLDEPTNDLDIAALAVLEKALAGFPGAILLVSHDRAFMDRVVGRVLAFTGQGRIVAIAGGYSDYVAWKAKQPPALAVAAQPAARAARVRRQAKLSYKEQRQLEALPEIIEGLEAEKAAIEARFCDPGYFQRDATAYRRDLQRLQDVNAELEAAYKRWQQLEEKRAALAASER